MEPVTTDRHDEDRSLSDGPAVDLAELTAEALAAPGDVEVPDDAVTLDAQLGQDDFELLPIWYMPSPPAGATPLDGWRRRLVVTLIGSIVLVNAAGFCVVYGYVTVG